MYTGNSVKLWSDFFNQGFIFGIDNMDKYLKIPLSGENYEILIKEAYNIESVDFFKKRGITFDIIIEDGLHSFETQMYALEHYYELLNRGGMMIIENKRIIIVESINLTDYDGISMSIIDTISLMNEGWTVTAFKNETTELKALLFVLYAVVPLNITLAECICENIHKNEKADVYTGNKEHCEKIATALKFIKIESIVHK